MRFPGNLEGVDGIDNYAFHVGLARFPYYFASFAPEVVAIRAGRLPDGTASLWKEWYERGLAEMLYRSCLPRTIDLANPSDSVHSAAESALGEEALVFQGGGKDSAVAGELLADLGVPVCWMTLGSSDAQQRMIRAAPFQRSLAVLRRPSRRLRRLRLYRGHKPFCMTLAFVGVLAAALTSRRYVATAHEYSANFGVTLDDGSEINHQHTKSHEFERQFHDYAARHINPSLHYFSVVRPLYELQIARMFAGTQQYHRVFASCNRKGRSWCRRCSKCAFVSLALYPFAPAGTSAPLLQGTVLGRSSSLSRYLQLTGQRGHKPFECVGTIEESRVAMALASRRPDPPRIVRHFIEHIPDVAFIEDERIDAILEHRNTEHLIPQPWREPIEIRMRELLDRRDVPAAA